MIVMGKGEGMTVDRPCDWAFTAAGKCPAGVVEGAYNMLTPPP